jgi:hypothetical protein
LQSYIYDSGGGGEADKITSLRNIVLTGIPLYLPSPHPALRQDITSN